ncbi:hypothetical protein ABPG77_000680 [Micractinium sp. CCAP 211/92]
MRGPQPLQNSSGVVVLHGASGSALPDPERVQQYSALICLNATIAAQQIQPAVYSGGSEAAAAAAALLNTTSCPPPTNVTEAGPSATFDTIMTSLTLHNTDTAPDVVARWLVDLINATNAAGIPACATLTSVARHGGAWGYNETTIWTGSTPGV